MGNATREQVLAQRAQNATILREPWPETDEQVLDMFEQAAVNCANTPECIESLMATWCRTEILRRMSAGNPQACSHDEVQQLLDSAVCMKCGHQWPKPERSDGRIGDGDSDIREVYAVWEKTCDLPNWQPNRIDYFSAWLTSMAATVAARVRDARQVHEIMPECKAQRSAGRIQAGSEQDRYGPCGCNGTSCAERTKER